MEISHLRVVYQREAENEVIAREEEARHCYAIDADVYDWLPLSALYWQMILQNKDCRVVRLHHPVGQQAEAR